MTTDESNLFWAQLIVEELRRHNIAYFCLCPGSRSSPLAVALARENRVRTIVHSDERGAAYHAVGYARATGRAATVVTTSGTAAANLFPGVVEAAMDHLPLIVITADRPPELRNCGANQTIDQVELFGDYVRFFADLPCPDDPVDPMLALNQVDQAVSRAHSKISKPGPVHLNCMYREPMVPLPEQWRPLAEQITDNFPHLAEWHSSGSPYTPPVVEDHEPATSELATLAAIMSPTDCGLLLVGRLDTSDEQAAILKLGQKLGWPLMVDVTSGLGSVSQPGLVNHHDLVLISEQFQEDHRPDMILHLGGRFVSKRLLQFIEKSKPKHYIQNTGDGQQIDPAHVVTQNLDFNNTLFCQGLASLLHTAVDDSPWTADWAKASAAARKTVAALCRQTDCLTEPFLANAVGQNLNPQSGLFLASSMPIRDLNMFGPVGRKQSPVASNRGASGIDGTIASACGYAVGLDKPTVLLIGDQALLHDINSLALVDRIKQPVTIVVVNNNGGRIFEHLPIARHTDILEPYFVAPHDMNFVKVADAFGLGYHETSDPSTFIATYAEAQESGQSSVIEATVDPEASMAHRNRIIDAVRELVDQI